MLEIALRHRPDAFVAALGARVLEADASEADLEGHLGTPDDPVVLLLRPQGIFGKKEVRRV